MRQPEVIPTGALFSPTKNDSLILLCFSTSNGTFFRFYDALRDFLSVRQTSSPKTNIFATFLTIQI